MFSVGIVIGLDVIEEFGFGVGEGLEASILEHLVFEGADEGFGPCVVIRVGACGHALAKAGACQGRAEGSAGVLASPVAVEDGPGNTATAAESLA